jgi:hypothetical protein
MIAAAARHARTAGRPAEREEGETAGPRRQDFSWRRGHRYAPRAEGERRATNLMD